MYRRETILARNISIEVTLRRSFRSPVGFTRIALGAHFLPDVLARFFLNYLANVVHGSWKVGSTKHRCVSGSRQSLRGITALSV